MITPRLLDRLRGGVPPNVALMHLLIEAPSEAAAREALAALRRATDDAGEVKTLQAVEALWAAHPGAWDAVRLARGHAEHALPQATPEAALAYWSRAFDALAEDAPEAGVALYALGSPDLLAAATAEVVDRLGAWQLFGPARDVLDLGCGIGRFAAALAPHVRSVLGLDLSPNMVAEARRRCAHLRNVWFDVSTGRDLGGLDDDSVDLILAADVFPYLVEAGEGLARAHVAEAARVLRPGGDLVVLNYSYRGDLGRDAGDIAEAARDFGFEVRRSGTSGFRLWDAATFHLTKRLA